MIQIVVRCPVKVHVVGLIPEWCHHSFLNLQKHLDHVEVMVLVSIRVVTSTITLQAGWSRMIKDFIPRVTTNLNVNPHVTSMIMIKLILKVKVNLLNFEEETWMDMKAVMTLNVVRAVTTVALVTKVLK